MQLKRSWEYGAQAQKRFSVADAVEMTCSSYDSDTGTLENLQSAQRATAALLGALVETLASSGVLPGEAVLELVSGFSDASEEPRT